MQDLLLKITIGADGKPAIAELKNVQRELKKTETTARQSGDAATGSLRGLYQQAFSLRTVLSESGIGGSVAIFGGIAAAAYAAYKAVSSLTTGAITAANSLNMMQAKLTLLSGTASAFANTLMIADRLGASLDTVQGMVSRFTMMRDSIGLTNQDAQRLATTVLNIGRISSVTAEEIKSAALQLSQSLASGRFQGDELCIVMEQMPMLGKVLAEQLGVSVGQLKQMGSEGKLTADIVAGALLRASQQVADQAAKLPTTLEQANARFETQSQLLLAHLGNVTGLLTLWQKIVDKSSEYAKNLRVALGGGTAEENQRSETEKLLARRQEILQELKRTQSTPFSPAPAGTYLGMENTRAWREELDKIESRLGQIAQDQTLALRLKDIREFQEQQEAASKSALGNLSTYVKTAVAAISGMDKSVKTAIDIAAAKNNIDPNLLYSLAYKESGLNPAAVAKDKYGNVIKGGGQGLFQFIPSTWQQWGQGQDVSDAYANADAAARYIKYLLEKFGTIREALRHYGGVGNAKNPLDEGERYMDISPADSAGTLSFWRRRVERD